jgi:hypothetical protein
MAVPIKIGEPMIHDRDSFPGSSLMPSFAPPAISHGAEGEPRKGHQHEGQDSRDDGERHDSNCWVDWFQAGEYWAHAVILAADWARQLE